MVRYSRLIFSFLVILLFCKSTLALTARQSQDIKFSRAKNYLAGEQKKKAMTLFKDILSGPFHYDAEIFLARFFFEDKVYTKSFRLYQHILRNTYSDNVIKYAFSPRARTIFRDFVKKDSNPSPQVLITTFELAEKYFEAFTFKYMPEEFTDSILNLSEKYFHVVDVNGLYPAISKFYLAKIYVVRGETNLAIKTLREVQKAYDEDPEASIELGLKDEDIKILMAEALAKEGFNDSSILVLLNLKKRKNLTYTSRHYVTNYLEQFEKSFLRTTFTYQLKNKNNINQLGSEDYQNFDSLSNRDSLGRKDSFSHYSNLHVYYHRRISNEQELGFNGNYINETPVSSSVSGPKSNTYQFDVHYKYHTKDNRFWDLGYEVQSLSGRELATLVNFQSKFRHIFTPSHIWVNPDYRLVISLPIELRKTQTDRSTTSFGAHAEYKPYLRYSWLNPSLYGGLRLRSEGEDLSSSFILQLGAENSYQITEKVNWVASADYYLNSNSSALINYSEIAIGNYFSYPLTKYKSLLLEADVNYRSRSNDIVGSINTFDIGFGFTYTF